MNENVIIAAFGGLIYNVLQLIELSGKSKESRPDFKDVLYWLPYAVWPVLGGLFAYVYQTPQTPLTKMLSLHIGVSAPLIFRQMLQIVPITPNQLKLKDKEQ